MKKITFLSLLLIGLSVTNIKETCAQVAIGLRAGLPTGISFKFKPMERRAVELIVGTYGQGNLNLTGIYEFQKQIGDVTGLMFYAGPGIHLNVQNDVRYYRYYRYDNRRYDVTYGNGTYLSGGVDAIFGIEYKIPDFPMSVGADLKPALDIGRYDAVFFMDAALNVRFHL